MKKYNCAPLPFQGQKRRWIADFEKVLLKFENAKIFIDLFGGSGLLSHTVKRVRPDARVIYNDFDNFSERLTSIDKTNALLADLRLIVGTHPRKQRITENLREAIIERIREEHAAGYVDWITISGSLLFSMNYAISFEEFVKQTFYNRIKETDYNVEDYLQGVETVRTDYKNLFKQYKNKRGVVFIADPPYLSTDSCTYNSDGYWRLRDYLDVLSVLTMGNYVYFTSDRSSIPELCDWMESFNFDNPFRGAVRKEIISKASFNAQYTDIMFYKTKETDCI